MKIDYMAGKRRSVTAAYMMVIIGCTTVGYDGLHDGDDMSHARLAMIGYDCLHDGLVVSAYMMG